MPLNAGRRLGPYEIVAPIGAGGMGEVYEARDTRLGRTVAIKVLPEGLSRDGERRARFEREARAVSQLSHPHVCTLHDVGEEEGVSFLVLELCEGETLAARLERGALPLPEVLRHGAQIAEALDAAHRRGVVHRDLKPANVMLTASGIKLLDFGLARLAAGDTGEVADLPTMTLDGGGTLTEEGTLLGTWPYMAPEQVEGREADARSDIFSLGAVLYEMATGRRAFPGETAAATLSSVLRYTPPSVTELRPELPRHLGRIIRHCLEKDPERRTQSARDVRNELADLERELEGPQPQGERVSPAARRKVAVAVAAGALLLLAALAWWRLASPAQAAIDSIAVLPFSVPARDLGAAHLGEGLAEDLIHSLSELSGLRVVPRTLSFRYREGEVPLERVAEELGVRAVVTGRVDRRGDRLVVAAELIDVATVDQLWGGRYDRPSDDLIAIEDEIVREVAEELRLRLSAEEERRIARRPTEDPAAYELYLRSRHHIHRWEFREATDLARRAVEHDPRFARAWAALAESYATGAFFGQLPPVETFPRGEEAARQAVALDEGLSDPHRVLGLVAWAWKHDWADAERFVRRAIELEPQSSLAHANHAAVMTSLARHDEALAAARRAVALDPTSSYTLSNAAWTSYAARRHDDALNYLDRLHGIDPLHAWGHTYRAYALSAKGETGRAVELYRQRREGNENSWPPGMRLGLAYLLAADGRGTEARALLETLEEEPTEMRFSQVLALLGEHERAFAALERALAEPYELELLWLLVDPRNDALRGDPRFLEALRRLDLPLPEGGG